MLSTLKRWIGRDGHAGSCGRTQAPRHNRPAVGEYRPELVSALREDHEQLLALFAELERASERNDETGCRSALDRFTRLLQDHLLTENRHLYGYFSRHPDPNPDVARRVETMSADMMRVGRILHRFISSCARATWTGDLHTRMRADLGTVGEVLMHRIHEEETVLYPMYAPPAG